MMRLCSRTCPSLFFSHTAPAVLQVAVPFSLVQKRFYCPDAKLHEQVAYNRFGFKGLSEEEQRNALKVLHNFVMKRMTQQDYPDSLKAMYTMAELTEYSSPYSPISGAHLRNYDFYKNHPSQLQNLYEIFADSGLKLFRSGDPKQALPLLKQALTLKVPVDEWNFMAISIRNAIEIAILCQDYRSNCYAHAQVFKLLGEKAVELNLPKDQIAALFRNEAACLAFDLFFKQQSKDSDKLTVHFGTQLFKKASLYDPEDLDAEAIHILKSFASRTDLGFSTKLHLVWKEGSLPYIDIPKMLFVF